VKVILLKDAEKIGKKGEVKQVSDGYARNFLIPRGIAAEASDGIVKEFQNIKKVKTQHEEHRKQESQEKLEKLMKNFFVIQVKAGEKNKLYGSITAADIAQELEDFLGEKVDKRWISVKSPIKELGTYDIPVKFPGNVKGTLKVKLEKK